MCASFGIALPHGRAFTPSAKGVTGRVTPLRLEFRYRSSSRSGFGTVGNASRGPRNAIRLESRYIALPHGSGSCTVGKVSHAAPSADDSSHGAFRRRRLESRYRPSLRSGFGTVDGTSSSDATPAYFCVTGNPRFRINASTLGSRPLNSRYASAGSIVLPIEKTYFTSLSATALS